MDALARYEEVVEDLIGQNPDLSRARMMGMPSLKVDGKMVGGFWKDEMVFKLTDEAVRERALGIDGAHLFDPSGRGRPMREWVAVPFSRAEEWPELAEQTLAR
jgi:hypothetical protein